jgi:hypothetical protein
MGNIVTVEANAILASSVNGTTYPLATRPVMLALITTATPSTNTAAGSEVSNSPGPGSYARQDTTTTTIWGTPSGGTITNSASPGTVSFTSMPACTIGGIELWDSAVRTVSDGVTTSTSATITSATAAFTSADVGTKISGSADIPSNTTILSVTNSTTAVMSANATGSHTAQTFNIVTPVRRWFGTLSANKTVNAGDTVTFAQSSISITLS